VLTKEAIVCSLAGAVRDIITINHSANNDFKMRELAAAPEGMFSCWLGLKNRIINGGLPEEITLFDHCVYVV
jgi:hypothetical protein